MGYRLPRHLRDSFRDPIGRLFTGNYQVVAKEASQYIKSLKPLLVISIGDFCTKTLLDVNFFPEIVIHDQKTHRTQKVSLNLDSYYNFEAINPPEWILNDTWKTIENAIDFCIQNNCRVAIYIKGEEDLTVIPAIISLPLGSIVVYGQPKIKTEEGIVVAQITAPLKKIMKDLLNMFEFTEDYEEFKNGDQSNRRKI